MVSKCIRARRCVHVRRLMIWESVFLALRSWFLIGKQFMLFVYIASPHIWVRAFIMFVNIGVTVSPSQIWNIITTKSRNTRRFITQIIAHRSFIVKHLLSVNIKCVEMKTKCCAIKQREFYTLLHAINRCRILSHVMISLLSL